MLASMIVLLVRPSFDLIAVIGTPWNSDETVIQRDCSTFTEFWKPQVVTRGMWRSATEASLTLRALRHSMSARKSGRLAIFVSGHGTTIRLKGKVEPALSLETRKGTHEVYPWSKFFKELGIPKGWTALLVPDT